MKTFSNRLLIGCVMSRGVLLGDDEVPLFASSARDALCQPPVPLQVFPVMSREAVAVRLDPARTCTALTNERDPVHIR
jgi:hypothetical protein